MVSRYFLITIPHINYVWSYTNRFMLHLHHLPPYRFNQSTVSGQCIICYTVQSVLPDSVLIMILIHCFDPNSDTLI